MKVAFFLPHFGDGGVERNSLLLAAAFQRHGAVVDLLTLSARGPFLRQIPSGIRVLELGGERTVLSIPRLVRYLREEGPAALISAQHYANIASVWARLLAGGSTRLILTERVPLMEIASISKPAVRRMLPLLMRWFYPRADAVVAVSDGVREDVQRLLGKRSDSVHLIHNPTLDPAIEVRAREPLEHPWFAPGEPPVIVGVGRLSPEKDFGTLLRAFAQIRERMPARLVIIGEGRERGSLEELARDLGVAGDVDLPGFDANPYRYMARAAVFAHSSRYEGSGNVLIEALACGTPVVATDCPSGPREILLGGRGGALVPVGDAAVLAKTVQDLLENPTLVRKQLTFARSHLDRFNPDACFRAYRRLIHPIPNVDATEGRPILTPS